MVAPYFIRKTENVLSASLGTVFVHGLVGDNGLGLTPAGSFGETRINLRNRYAADAVFVSVSNSVNVTVTAAVDLTSNVDIVCQRYMSIIA